jgi:hypothetical protein
VNGNEEYDFLYNNLSRLVLNYPVSYYQLTDSDVMRPDLVSYKMYNTTDFWWLILYVNDIEDPLTDLVSGTIVKIPNVLDIYAFYKSNSFR